MFVAGLEGTGHHGMKSLLGVTKLLYKKAGMDGDATQAIFHHTLPDYKTLHDDRRKDVDILKEREHLKAHMLNLIGNATEKGSTGNIFLLNPAEYGSYTMLSYPNMGGSTKSLQHPDMVTLAKLCEEVSFCSVCSLLFVFLCCCFSLLLFVVVCFPCCRLCVLHSKQNNHMLI